MVPMQILRFSYSALATITDMIALSSLGRLCQAEISSCVSLKYHSWCVWHSLEKPGWHLCVLNPSQFSHAKLSSYVEGTGKRMRLPPKRSDILWKWSELTSLHVNLQTENELFCVSFWTPFAIQTGVQCPNERWGIFLHNLLCASSAVVLMGGGWTGKRKTAFSFLEL